MTRSAAAAWRLPSCRAASPDLCRCIPQALALARQLRASGQFTVVAVTKPFGFEGTRRLAAADKMIAELESIAQLVRA